MVHPDGGVIVAACDATESSTKSPGTTPNSASEYVVSEALVIVVCCINPVVLMKLAARVSDVAPLAFNRIWHPIDAWPPVDAVEASRLPVGVLVAPPAWSAIVTLGPAVDAVLDVKLPGIVIDIPPEIVVKAYVHTNCPFAKFGATDGARNGDPAPAKLAVTHCAEVSIGLVVSHPEYETAVVVVQLAPLQVIDTLVGSPAWYAL